MTVYASSQTLTVTRRVHAGDWQIELLPTQAYETAFTTHASVVGFAFDAQKGVHALGSDRRQSFTTRASTLAYVPEGCDVFSESADGGEYLRIHSTTLLPKPTINRCFSNLADRQAAFAAHKLRRHLLSNDDANECATLAAEIVARIEKTLVGASTPNRDAHSMTAYRMSQIDELIESSNCDGPTVAVLAKEVGLSVGFFTRSFTAAVGRTPQEYVLDYRISRARKEIKNSSESLAVISATCGFASHAHMTSQFRARLGITPSQLRPERMRFSQ